jgi:hypothetical protein
MAVSGVDLSMLGVVNDYLRGRLRKLRQQAGLSLRELAF